MPKLSKRDQRAKVSATEANRRRSVAISRLRELQVEREEKKIFVQMRHYVQNLAVKERNAFLAFVPRLSIKIIGEFDGLDPARLQLALERGVREFLSERSSD